MQFINRYFTFRKEEAILGVSVFLLTFLVIFLSRFTRLENTAAIDIPQTITLLLSDDGDLKELQGELSILGVTTDSLEYEWARKEFGFTRYKAGRYVFESGISYKSLFQTLNRGLQTPMMVTIPSGQFQDRLIQRIAARFRFSEHELMLAMVDSTFLKKHDIEQRDLVGRLIPNTYEMYWTITPEQFLDRMMSEFDAAVIQPYNLRANELNLTIDEVTTLASIIEWEVRHVDEKPRVSGLYWNRLNRTMLLQADPTVAYAIGERRRLLFSDYRVNHPYNTYRVRGLPPGPLNNPRLTSIQAALFPEEHNYLFMVATPEGYHSFTTNYQDHLKESRKWTSWLREQREIRAKREAEQQLLNQSQSK
jgi:UPF0755 protein